MFMTFDCPCLGFSFNGTVVAENGTDHLFRTHRLRWLASDTWWWCCLSNKVCNDEWSITLPEVYFALVFDCEKSCLLEYFADVRIARGLWKSTAVRVGQLNDKYFGVDSSRKCYIDSVLLYFVMLHSRVFLDLRSEAAIGIRIVFRLLDFDEDSQQITIFLPLTFNILPLTCRLLPLTFNILLLTCSLLPLIFRLLPLTFNILPLICSLLPLTFNLSPLTSAWRVKNPVLLLNQQPPISAFLSATMVLWKSLVK